MPAFSDTRAAAHAPPARVGDPTGERLRGTGSAHGKAILIGEHAVVYGRAAIALPVHSLRVRAEAVRTAQAGLLVSDLYTGAFDAAPARLAPTVTAARATLEALGTREQIELRVHSGIPPERGVGSSAAVAAAVVAAVAAAFGIVFDDGRHHELVQVAERAAHGTPSGLDARAVRAAGPIWFRSGETAALPVGATFAFVIADSGVPGRTGEAVRGVRALREADPARVDHVIASLGVLAEAARGQLSDGDVPGLGAAMDEAHDLLDGLGLGDPALQRLVRAARGAGASGAKLTGGGRGGCVLVLAPDAADAPRLACALTGAGAAAVWTSTLEATA